MPCILMPVNFCGYCVGSVNLVGSLALLGSLEMWSQEFPLQTYYRDPHHRQVSSTTNPLITCTLKVKQEAQGLDALLDKAQDETQSFWKWEIHGMTPELLQAFNFTSILYTLNIHPWGPNVTPLYDQPYSRYKIVENRKCTLWPQKDLNNLSVKRTHCDTLNAHPRGPNSPCFALGPAVFEIQGCRKLEMNQMTPEWP